MVSGEVFVMQIDSFDFDEKPQKLQILKEYDNIFNLSNHPFEWRFGFLILDDDVHSKAVSSLAIHLI